jgi:formylglycine-generating enzyme required for sulfatase activity
VGLIHRDIKPANLWLEALPGEPEAGASGVIPYRVKILDFGLARPAADNAHLTQHGAIIGTPAYMAPEQGAGKALDARCDLFSLGCVLYQLATGQAPFNGSDTVSTLLSAASDEPPPPHEVNPAVPEELSDLVMDLLAKKPEARPESAREVAERLATLAMDSTAEATKRGRATGSPRRGKTRVRSASAQWRGPRLAAGAAVSLVVLLLGAGLLWSLRTRAGALGSTEVVLDAKWTPTSFTNSLGMEFVLVPRGKSWLGGGAVQAGNKEVEIKEDFYLGKYEVTQEEWGKVMAATPSHFSRAGAGKDAVKDIPDAELKRFPVEMVSWDDAQLFLRQLNQQDRQEGWVYRLPTQVEWEYACRGGPMGARLLGGFDFYCEKPTNQLEPQQANIIGNGRTCKVGSYPPNRLGLYDMHGNVWEWCDDPFDPEDPAVASLRAIRGGCYVDVASDNCRAADRHATPPSLRSRLFGLRVARVPVGAGG